MGVREITIPYIPRAQFAPFHERSQRWACLVAHRRAGKTVACVNDLIRRAIEEGKEHPRYAYLAPYFSQAKAVAWDYLKRFAAPIMTKSSESELSVELINGARIRLFGADNPDALRGQYLDGVVMDEIADMRPNVWPEIVRPALADRKGWATFIGTPRGNNHFREIWDIAIGSSDWYAAQLRASETGILDDVELADAKRMMSEEQYEQEFECSFSAAVMGAYYAKELEIAERDGRITVVPYDASAPITASWDIGFGDATAIWCAQQVGMQVRIIDYYEASGADIGHYVKWLNARPYTYAESILPHDAAAGELGTGKSISQMLSSLGVRNRVLKQRDVDASIMQARQFLSKCWFDAAKCKDGLEAMRQYRAEYDEERKTLKRKPLHDWCSHAADSFAYLALGWSDRAGREKPLSYPKPMGVI